jgi:hypothetical protein
MVNASLLPTYCVSKKPSAALGFIDQTSIKRAVGTVTDRLS